ncbi:hypothetical protein [Singulisphaera acidiphila]|uniref:Uncharacterized protein n=1 Tax=Singulisphaera acidiphila (strain ATCC BAA-1392 / DSM 18658 / VKM B-2454 / MOB10) TaxID=886293 RepID=L0DFW7_SINAD|nr:hypothetical protein [Singulisphaera acidiphila]AGA27556.1 hypothetical protein Sinac_3286 [Singulisphaera acidiphila DSM 18658]
MDEPDDEAIPTTSGNAEINQLIGLFDLPAFARRGQDLEYSIKRTHERCQRERNAMLDMVRVRLRQWASAVTGPESSTAVFASPIESLWPLSGAENPVWARHPAPPRRQRTIALDLISSAVRFNRRWSRFLDELGVDHLNHLIDQYNRYYLLEKECCLGSSRLAARFFIPQTPITRDTLIGEYPLLTVPELKA